MAKNVSKHPENQQIGAQNFLKSGNFLKILMPNNSYFLSCWLQVLSFYKHAGQVLQLQ